MRIEELIKLINRRRIFGITANSKLAGKNFIFVAVKGARDDGGKFIAEAVKRGARFIVCEPGVKIRRLPGTEFVEVKDTRAALAELAACFYRYPSQKLKVVGITGTNGKTTITYLLEALLKEAGKRPGVIGTINYRFQRKSIPAKNTTPGPVEIQSLLAEMVKAGVDYAVMEVSSHALDQQRVGRINFHSAIFTNLTQDHLDYHKTLKNYFSAKAKLFKAVGPGSFAVINNDDRYGARLKRATRARVITYGIKHKADVTAANIKFDFRHTEFDLRLGNKKETFRVRLIGRHNIYNLLAAASWGIKEGIGLKTIKAAFEKFQVVPGRLEQFHSRKGFSVFVDYAHTPDALKNVLDTLRELAPRRIITLFGCGGDRDRLKRPKMGKVVAARSDFAVITSDNPRSEDPADIAGQIKKGIKGTHYCVVLDRRAAIKRSLSMARPGDIVLLAGKGHEGCQVLKEKVVDFDDRKEVRLCLR